MLNLNIKCTFPICSGYCSLECALGLSKVTRDKKPIRLAGMAALEDRGSNVQHATTFPILLEFVDQLSRNNLLYCLCDRAPNEMPRSDPPKVFKKLKRRLS